jgi:hypothetical protein
MTKTQTDAQKVDQWVQKNYKPGMEFTIDDVFRGMRNITRAAVAINVRAHDKIQFVGERRHSGAYRGRSYHVFKFTGRVTKQTKIPTATRNKRMASA